MTDQKSLFSGLKIITIDGPAGAGKSTVAKALAERFHWIYVTTGAIYRVLSLWGQREGVDPKDTEKWVSLALQLESFYRQDSCTGQVFFQEEDVTSTIKEPWVSQGASHVATMPEARTALLPLQRRIVIEANGAVVDGRDMGTVVFPDAPLKFFLTADPQVRAKRRYLELQEKNSSVSFEEVLQEILERDERDTQREVAKLEPAKDAIMISSSSLTAQEVVDLMVSYGKQFLGEKS